MRSLTAAVAPLAAVFLVAVAFRVPAFAQAPWRPELGIQGGFARFKPTGTGLADQTDLWDAPGDGSRYTSVFAIIPLRGRLAFEPSLSASQTSLVGNANGVLGFASTSRVTVVLRGNVALVSGLYAAAGGMLRYLETNATGGSRLGLVAGLGYRAGLGAGFAARIEATAATVDGTARLFPFNIYGLLIGVSKRAGGAAAQPQGGAPWRAAFGVAGGYVQNHSRGAIGGLPVTLDQTQIAFPGSAATTPPTLYAIVPVRGPLALELGFDVHRSAQNDTASFSAQFAPRLDVALAGGWYGAAGGSVHYVEATASPGIALAGATVAAGYRFPLTAALGGRVELSYTAFKERQDFPLAQNIVAVMVGATMPLR